MANGTALRMSDTGWPRKSPAKEGRGEGDVARAAEMAGNVEAGVAGVQDDAAPSKMTIVLLHGYLESIEVWDDFTDLLKPRMRVVAADLPGHGISEVKGDVHTMEFLADTVHAALVEMGIEKCVVCGHSMGGYVALEVLRKYPEMLAGIILFHSVPFADTPEKKAARDREIEVVIAGKKDLLAATSSKVFAPANRKRFANRIEELADQAFLTEDAGVLALLRGMEQRRDNNPALSESLVPQMFIFGRGDEYIPVEVAEEIARQHPRARTIWLENSGHIGFIEEPQAAAGAVTDFCRSLDW